MVVGGGDIAKALIEFGCDRATNRHVFIASGLSNSSRVTYEDYEREINLITSWMNVHVIYFSSLCIYYSNSPYSRYKQTIERHIQATCKNWTIVRLGNITWGDNPHTLLNYLKAHPEAERRDEVRYLVDKEEFLHWIGKIRYGVNDIINIPGKRVNVKDL